MVNQQGVVVVYLVSFVLVAAVGTEAEKGLGRYVLGDLYFERTVSRVCSLQHSSQIRVRLDMSEDYFCAVLYFAACYSLQVSVQTFNLRHGPDLEYLSLSGTILIQILQ